MENLIICLLLTVYYMYTHITNKFFNNKLTKKLDNFLKFFNNKKLKKSKKCEKKKIKLNPSNQNKPIHPDINLKCEVRHHISQSVITNDIKPNETKSANIKPNAGQVTTSIRAPYSPQMIRDSYQVKLIQPAPNDKKPKVCIIAVGYYDIQSSFNKWLNYYGLPAKTINVINLDQSKKIPDAGWALEAMLDTCAVYTTNPYADIYVIFAQDGSFGSLGIAINSANNLLKIDGGVVSMSFGSTNGVESNYFESYFNLSNVSYLVSSGDNKVISYPSSSPLVLSIGGTNLTINYNNGTQSYIRTNETAWNSAGFGISKQFTKPTYQNNISIYNSNSRYTPDFCSLADPSTGMSIYSPINNQWFIVGGTSLACPLVAGCISCANYIRLKSNKKSLTTINSTNSIQNSIYNLYQTNNSKFNSLFYDIKSGSILNTQASVGIDKISGLGVPYYGLLSDYLASLA